MSIFKFFTKFLFVFTALIVSCSGGGVNSSCTLKSSGYCILMDENPVSIKWSNYLYKELQKRTSDKNILHLKVGKRRCEKIKVEIDGNCKYDYCIVNRNNTLILKTQHENVMTWLIAQYIKQLGSEDERFEANDLPPAIINFETGNYKFDFEYREPFFSYNIKDGHNKMLCSNLLDTDWGIWGHNLHKILENKDNYSIYAVQNGIMTKEQYCFSSESLFQQIKEYIHKNYDDVHKQRFLIMPNDNMIVCQCDLCKAKGNTKNNATPAVTHLIKKLANEFSNHVFFTSAYLTTELPPVDKWPSNTGVMLSTINLPKGVPLNEQQKEIKRFIQTLTLWKNNVNRIYIWDYAANFDDYFTPLPVLYGLKEQLQFYKSKGINGIFLNAAGYDYSPFDDVKTFVAAALMINSKLSVDELCKDFFTQKYPVAGQLLTSYYLSLEKEFQLKNKPYNMYAGFREISKSYLNQENFVKFYDSLSQLIPETKGKEQNELQKLHTALSFCRLQIAHTQGSNVHGYAILQNKQLILIPECETICSALLKHKDYEDMQHYKETQGDLKDYLTNWNNLFNSMPYENLLINEPFKVISKLDEEYTQINMLNDGVTGFNYNYHQGWFLTSTDNLQIYIDTQNLKKVSQITIRFLVDEKHHIYSPVKIEILKNSQPYKVIAPSQKLNYNTPRTDIATIDVDLKNAENILLTIYRYPNSKSSIACDEIQLK